MGFLELIKRKSTRYWLFQCIGWGAYGLLLFLSLYKNTSEILWQQLLVLGFTSFFGILITHQIRRYLIKKNFYDFEAKKFLFPVLFLAFLGAVIHSLGTKLYGWVVLPGSGIWDFLTLLINASAMFMIFLLWNAIYFSFVLFEESQRKQLNYALLSKSQVELELQILRSQLNPHFLFNALNAIRALIDLDPENARKSITLLSSLLRNTLKINTEKTITLHQELEIVNAYLELEKMRFEERLDYEIRTNNTNENTAIPSLLLQTLVENAIKHGISKSVKGGKVIVEVEQNDSELQVNVVNDGQLSNQTDLGIGLSNLKKRLALQYGNDFDFQLKNEESRVRARVWIKENRNSGL